MENFWLLVGPDKAAPGALQARHETLLVVTLRPFRTDIAPFLPKEKPQFMRLNLDRKDRFSFLDSQDESAAI